MYNLPSYGGSFSQYDNIQFLSPERAKNIELLDKLSGGVKEKKTILETVHKPLVESISTLVNGRKVSAYHMLTDIDTQREIDSMKSLSKLKKLGINYNICVNKRYTQLPPAETCEYPEKISMEPGGKLTPGHYGCYLAHKDAFFKGLESDSDFILIFECDCVIDVSYEEFMEKLEFACSILDKTDLLMFSFGYHNNTNIVARHEDYWEVDRFYGAHAYLIPRRSFENIKRMYDTCKWNVTDLLFAEKLNHYRTGIFETPITKQAAGYSILDKVYNEERH
jgi:GR25 family glycosyltransferase involved in LPS biosynthesis